MVIEGKYEDSETYTEKEFSELDKFSLQENNTLEVVPSKVQKVGAHLEEPKTEQKDNV